MEKTFSKVEELASHIKEYINIRISAIKLSAAEKSSKMLANLIAVAVVLMVFFSFVLFASVALAFVFSKLTGEYYRGFLIVAGIYLLIGLIVWTMKEKLLRLPIMNAMLRQLFKEEDDESDEEN